jgi:pyruvate,water dikinase
MNPDDKHLGAMLHALQERAKELNCLYQVGEILESDSSPEELFRRVIEILPPGWQFPHICQARITYKDLVIEPQDYKPTSWVQRADIVVQGQQLGTVEVSYREHVPNADEGPFLKEERKLIETVAERISSAMTQRRLKAAFKGWAAATEHSAKESHEWQVVLEFLRDTDPVLLQRISRKLINQLSWSGLPEAKKLLQFAGANVLVDDSLGSDGNRPIPRDRWKLSENLSAEAFRIANEHLSETEILDCVTTWIKEDKTTYLVQALENQYTPLGELVEAVERFHHSGVDETELSVSTQKGLRVALLRRFFSESLDFINVAKEFVEIRDFYDLLGKIIYPPRCHGKLGGKSAGLFLAKKIVEKTPEATLLQEVKVPRTWYLTSDWILRFVHYNDLEDVLNRKYMEIDQIRLEYPHLVALFKSSPLPSQLAKALSVALDDLGDVPLIVRSSSLLEDRSGSAFSGKYKSLFLGNRGSKEERLAALMDAIAEVYASIFGPDPTEYRAERGLLDVHEEMGIMIQEVIGQRVGRYFMPACSGVAFSNNEFRWSARIKRDDGLIRLVPGLGTRAVDRVADDYPVLIAPGQPNLRVNVTVDEVMKYSPKHVDVINLETNAFETVETSQLLRECGAAYPQVRQLVSVLEDNLIRQPIGPIPDFGKCDAVFAFEGLIRNTPFVARVRELLSVLKTKLRTPVDIEFAYDGKDFYLLQCRPQSYGTGVGPVSIPQNLPQDSIVFSANRFISNGQVPDITHLVYIDLDGYSNLSENDMRNVGRAVGRLNKLLPKRQFILIGPGRWGSRGDIKLGVPVTYSDINNAAMLIEVARQKGNYLPELSFGTHFFQDLVEASIRYLPLYPDDPNTVFNEFFLRRSHNVLQDLLPDLADLADTVNVIDVAKETGGSVLRVLMNAELDQAVAFVSSPRHTAGQEEFEVEPGDRTGNEHWRWRYRMAQRIAAQLDPGKFGVRAFYLIGSTKNATAGPGSDIDLLLHFDGDDDQRKSLLFWLEGWSRCLGEINFLRTGYRADGLLDVHLVTDEDIAARTSFAVKIDATTDAARKLPMKEPVD